MTPSRRKEPELRHDGLYECPDCERTYDAEIALVWCCNSAALNRYGATSD
ncbi:hypothetical protein [Microbacterium sp. VKM Ac-2923]|nr:hypothetical protein [Microbacterium sp. VKM Ac-2923]MCJ1709254.1 hypothetical protein [Microbacterium sp. VKM Ac-2923]